MLIFIAITGLILTLNGNCQQNDTRNQDGSHFPSGQAAGNSSNANASQNSDLSQTQNGNETAGFIRKDTRNSEVITIGRNDGYHTTFATYENKGFYAQTGFGKSPPVPGNQGTTPRTYYAIGGVPVPVVPTSNEWVNEGIRSNIPPKTPVSIGGRPVEFKQHNMNSPNEPWTSYRKPEYQDAAGQSFGGQPLNYLDNNMDNPNQPWMSRIPGAIGGKPVHLTDNNDSPYKWWNNAKPNTSASYAADPSIGGNPVPLKVNFELDPFLNDKLVSNLGVGTRIGSGGSDYDNEDGTEDEETKRLGWQVSVFSKDVTPYVRVCGGSLVTSTAVISAAQCFWGVGALPANQFTVAADPVDNPNTTVNEYSSYLQKIDVRAIKIPPRFRGASSNYQEDIAVLLTQQPFVLHRRLRPVCVGFDAALDEKQLADGNQGVILGATIVLENASAISLLNHVVPVISIERCLQETPEAYLRFITSDKICAGAGASVCNQDIGSGLAFTFGPRNMAVPVRFLRGVASSLPFSKTCSAYGIYTFTHVQSHRGFILQHVPDIEKECSKYYPHVYMLMNAGTDGSQSEDDVEMDDSDERFVCNCYC